MIKLSYEAKISELMNNAKAYERVDPVLYVQTDLFVEREQMLGANSIDSFAGLISKKYSGYSADKNLRLTWNTLLFSSSTFDTDWTGFKNTFNTTWGGAEMIAEYSATAKKYLS